MADAWDEWWSQRGEEHLTLLLWAVWNPVGTCPPNEYAIYTSTVAAVMREAHEADAPLAARADDSSIQVQRNVLWNESVERLATLLGDLRWSRMSQPPEPGIDRHAAETLLDWLEWEMQDDEA